MVKPKRNVSFSNEFFKVYLSDFSSRQLSLPPAFGIQFNGKNEALPKNATLKDGNAKIWQVGLVKREEDWVIKDGWKEFACYHSLVDGDFLIFKFDGSSEFEVELYGNNGLKNNRLKKEGLFGKSGPKSSETKIAKLGECKGAKAPSSVPREVPPFVMNITRITRFARIPKKFLRENNIEVPKEIELRDESGKLWPVQISFWDSGYTVLTSGFSEFCRMNKLLPRDQCVFTFICSKGNLCKVIQVQFVRRGPRT
uniref:TF-B3 domain-containing protein n=1 Tax=Populus alba TaxID=43335 RepID=A0A4U5PX80_POPAL|nr:hypothetical protein D5086_0000163930 [Populus alba]